MSSVPQAKFSMRILEDGPVDAFCGWFDTQFKGSAENPATTEVTLSTAPDPTGATHWGQQVTVRRHAPSHSQPSHSLVAERISWPCEGRQLWLGTPAPPPGPLNPHSQSFFLHPPVECAEADTLACEIEVVRRKDNQR